MQTKEIEKKNHNKEEKENKMKRLMKHICNILFGHIFYRTQYMGLEHIPKDQNVILCPNHSHILDPVWIYAKVDHLHIMAKAELFKHKLLGKIFRYFGAFPVKRDHHDTASTMQAIRILQKDHSNLLIFLEGGILKDNEQKRKVRNGPTFLAATTGVPIIPVHISKSPRLFSKVCIQFGKPWNIEKEVLRNKEEMKKVSRRNIRLYL